ncbi:TFIIB-type zinc ribbon-containing protein [Lachnospira multipara]|uniref:TFIIB-type zinc ribbon-containing protein n=1 Tax=Lachnospira multipara TaxID=28051 RepID=UPI000485B052|nr:TFIIB-type zinc ribbon-containing protein [Lachnospira multipara]
MKIVSMVCPNCGASLHVDADQNNLTCNYCGNSLYVDDEVKHIQYDNAEETGYQFEKGRQRAQAEAFGVNQQTARMNFGQPPNKRKTWLWVLGWICIFPVPLTILMVRNQKLNKSVKIGIIAAAWIIYLLIALSGGGSGDNKDTSKLNTESSTVEQTTDESAIDNFIADINKSEDINLEYVEDFIPSDEEGEHYRTEFRLYAWKNSTGKSYKYGDSTVDIIISSGGVIQRIYMDGATLEQCENMIRYASSLLDSTATESDIQEAVDYVDEYKAANGYYYGKLGLIVLGHGDRGYEFMLKHGL